MHSTDYSAELTWVH